MHTSMHPATQTNKYLHTPMFKIQRKKKLRTSEKKKKKNIHKNLITYAGRMRADL